MLLLKLPEFRVNVESLAKIPLPDFLTALWKVSVKQLIMPLEYVSNRGCTGIGTNTIYTYSRQQNKT